MNGKESDIYSNPSYSSDKIVEVNNDFESTMSIRNVNASFKFKAIFKVKCDGRATQKQVATVNGESVTETGCGEQLEAGIKYGQSGGEYVCPSCKATYSRKHVLNMLADQLADDDRVEFNSYKSGNYVNTDNIKFMFWKTGKGQIVKLNDTIDSSNPESTQPFEKPLKEAWDLIADVDYVEVIDVNNIVLSGNYQSRIEAKNNLSDIRLNTAYVKFTGRERYSDVTYNPQIFPPLRLDYDYDDTSVNIAIFGNGKIKMAGASSLKEAKQAYDHTIRIVEELEEELVD